VSGPADTAVPLGVRVRLDRRAWVLEGGAVLIGGAPPRLVRLAPAVRGLLAGGGLTVTDRTSAALARRLLDAGLVHPVVALGHPTPQARPAPEVTVVVPVKDRTYGLARLLRALSETAAPAAVVVVDDGSADAAAVRAVADAAGARVVRHRSARGPAAARNAGAAAACTPLVAFLDSDVVPQHGWLDVLRAHFADPAVALAAPRIVAFEPVAGVLGRYEAVRSSLDLGPDPALVVPRTRVAYVPSAALLVRREAFGCGFDERMHVAEDVDLVLRLHAAGWRLRYDPAARVAHDHRTTLRAWWLRKAYYGTGAAPLAMRHRGAVPPLVLSPWSFAVGGLLLSARPRAVLGAAAVSVLTAARLARRLTAVRRPRVVAARLIARGLGGALGQTADAVTRHFWPFAALACLAGARARRVVAAVALAEAVVDWARRDVRPRPPLPAYVVARRLDDLAYGAGLWWGAWRHRTLAPFVPAWSGRGFPGSGAGKSVDSTRRRNLMAEREKEPVNPAGMPEIHPPKGGPNADPDAPDPEDLVPNRPGTPAREEQVDPEGPGA